MLAWVRREIVGHDAFVDTPFGRKRKRYFDYTASGLPFRPIEDAIRDGVLPYMANTHTESNYTAGYTTSLFEEAHAKIRRALNAREEDDVVIFTGSGATGAINKLIGCLGLRIPDILQERFDCASTIPSEARPLIIRSRMEHHSNDLPWRETIADTEYVGYDKAGRVDWRQLEALLSSPEYRDRPMKIGSFSAASNVTGILNDTESLSAAMHDGGGLAFFDYAAAGPYVDIDMHPDETGRLRKDAVFLSIHKFVGGPQSPGLLVANRDLFRTRAPAEPGGGTVLYTSPWEYRYLDNLQNREEGGTPPIVQVIRAGLVFDLKAIIGTERMTGLEEYFLERAVQCWRDNPRIEILGGDPTCTPHIGIMSLILDGGRLHHNLAARLLNDLYGIQVRGGCMCAGTYGHDLLDIDEAQSKAIRSQLDEGKIGIKPGWVRMSFGPGVSEEDLEILLEAVPHIAANWRTYAEDYVMNPATADWHHKSDPLTFPELTLPSPKF